VPKQTDLIFKMCAVMASDRRFHSSHMVEDEELPDGYIRATELH
jgi:hypothetical protein